MLFNSFEFFIFFPIVLTAYWLLPLRQQNLMLLAASYLFYGFWDWRFLSLIALSTLIDYSAGLKIEQARVSGVAVSQKHMKLWLLISICSNLGILGFFKYYNFFVQSAQEMLALAGLDIGFMRLDIVLPVGISFYTFQTMSYTIDVYRGVLRPIRNLSDYALYLSYFPQLVAGPIERATNLLPAITKRRIFNREQFQDGLLLILFGLFKKVYVADNLAPYVDGIFRMSDPSGIQVLGGMYAFAIQIYCDFSGYSDIARGCSKCLGINLMVNFRHPYIAINPADRWRRWHISLSTWLRDYLYIPMGGNRLGRNKTYRNLGLTMLLGGLWHGAAWNYVIWGAWEGLLLIVHRMFADGLKKIGIIARIFPAWVKIGTKIFVMFHLVCVGWIIFRCSSLKQIQRMFGNLLSWQGPFAGSPQDLFMPFVGFGLPLFFFEYLLHRVEQVEQRGYLSLRLLTHCVVYSVMFYMIAFYGASAQSFIYFQF
jgi:D-alanyl-lipoteichoic acid acyltransferase DltB (MBOAT superfamily)